MAVVNIDLTEFLQLKEELDTVKKKNLELESTKMKVVFEYKNYTGDIEIPYDGLRYFSKELTNARSRFDIFSNHTFTLNELKARGYIKVNLKLSPEASSVSYENLDTVKDSIRSEEHLKMESILAEANEKIKNLTMKLHTKETEYSRSIKENKEQLAKEIKHNKDIYTQELEKFKILNNVTELENKYYKKSIEFENKLLEMRMDLAAERQKSWFKKLLETLFNIK